MRIIVSKDSNRISVPEKRRSVTPTEETHESKALFNLALEQMGHNRIPEAMKSLEAALRISPRSGLYLSHYGVCVATERGDYATAVKLCERAIKLQPKDPVNRVNLGRVYRLKGRTGEAYEQFVTAWKMNRHHPAPAAELSRMGIRRPPVLRFLPRSHWLNRQLGKLRALVTRSVGG